MNAAPRIGEWIHAEGVVATDVDSLLARLEAAATRVGLRRVVLGSVGTDPIVMFVPFLGAPPRPRLLIAAGLHGEEPGGPFSVLSALHHLPRHLFELAEVSLLPVVNPQGLRAGRRENDRGENPNRGFCHTELGAGPSVEGRVLLEHWPTVVAAARDGFLAIHEDWEEHRFYLYSFEPTNRPGPRTMLIRDEGQRFFPLVSDGIVEGALISDGVVFKKCDGSFEDRLHHDGVPFAVCAELPGIPPIDRRVECGVAIIHTFLEAALELASRT
jgi:hypothetical protein